MHSSRKKVHTVLAANLLVGSQCVYTPTSLVSRADSYTSAGLKRKNSISEINDFTPRPQHTNTTAYTQFCLRASEKSCQVQQNPQFSHPDTPSLMPRPTKPSQSHSPSHAQTNKTLPVSFPVSCPDQQNPFSLIPRWNTYRFAAQTSRLVTCCEMKRATL